MFGTSFIYLTSRSVRRQVLLQQMGVNFELLLSVADALGSEIDETVLPGEVACDYVCRMAKEKAEHGCSLIQQQNKPVAMLLAADTIVVVNGTILGKPVDQQDAARMLSLFSGKKHTVLTAVAVAHAGRIKTVLSETAVFFRPLRSDDISVYLKTEEWLGKAGGYAIQGYASVFIERIEGSYSGVMGLPVFETAQLLISEGLTLD